jgi:hypothetical protein
VLAEGRDAGTFALNDPLQTARTLLLATNSLLPSNLSAAELGSRRQIERDVARVAELLIQGLLPRGAPARGRRPATSQP